MTPKIDCLGFGIAPADILSEIPHYPQAGAKVNATDMIIQGGGPVPTAMVTLARLGKKVALISAVGDDIFGQFVITELKNERVGTSLILKKKNAMTPIAVGWYEKGSGRRTIVLNLEINVLPREIKLKSLPRVRAIHLDGRYLPASLKLARWARRIGAEVILDIGSVRNDVTEILPLVDHLVCAEDFALPYTKTKTAKQAIEVLKKVCCGTIVVTTGTKGSIGFSKQSGMVSQKAFRVRTADTTGAGDVYHGAYIAALLDKLDLKERMKVASAAAAIKCTKPGGRTGIPNRAQLSSFLKQGPRTYA